MYIPHTHESESTVSMVWPRWLKRLGWLVLMVLFIKGIVWLTLPVLLVFVGVGI